MIARNNKIQEGLSHTPSAIDAAKRPFLKIRCPHCGRSVPVLDFTTTEQGLTITCPSCHERTFLEQPRSSRPRDREADDRCPKCLRPIRAGSISCPKCGLILSLWEKGRGRVPDKRSDTGAPDPIAEALWDKVFQNPGLETAHESFLVHCREHRCLDLAARRYQQFLHHHPESRLGALYRDRIILLAQFDHRPVQRPRNVLRRYSGIKIVLFLGFAALLWGLVMAQILLPR